MAWEKGEKMADFNFIMDALVACAEDIKWLLDTIQPICHCSLDT